MSGVAVNKQGTVLLLANNFPPIRGGSAVVYDNLARYSGGRVIVVAPSVHYADGLPIIGWREHDRQAPYRVIRLRLLRTVIQETPFSGALTKQLFRLSDMWIRIRLTRALLRLVRRENVVAICVGELLASSWVLALFRRIGRVRTVVYVHGEEITTEDPYDRAHDRAWRALLCSCKPTINSHHPPLCTI